MKGLNKVSLIGHLGKDPDVRAVGEGMRVSHVSLATTEMYRDKAGALKTQTDWHALVLWGKLSEVAEKHLHKGSLVYVEGKLKTRHYDDNAGGRRYVSEVIVEQLLMLK
jgi:single-strand DNA-binding protein